MNQAGFWTTTRWILVDGREEWEQSDKRLAGGTKTRMVICISMRVSVRLGRCMTGPVVCRKLLWTNHALLDDASVTAVDVNEWTVEPRTLRCF